MDPDEVEKLLDDAARIAEKRTTEQERRSKRSSTEQERLSKRSPTEQERHRQRNRSSSPRDRYRNRGRDGRRDDRRERDSGDYYRTNDRPRQRSVSGDDDYHYRPGGFRQRDEREQRERYRDREQRDRPRHNDRDFDSRGRKHERDELRETKKRSDSFEEAKRTMPAWHEHSNRRPNWEQREARYEQEGRDRRSRRHSPDRRNDRRGSWNDGRRRPSGQHENSKKSPDLGSDERDERTVFVQQLAQRLRHKDLTKFFESCGPVEDTQIVKDRVSGRSKGVGYVEFKEAESVPKAMQLTGQKLLGIPVIVQLAEAAKNRQVRPTAAGGNPQNAGVPYHRLYVGNIHFSITDETLKEVFGTFGEVEAVSIQKEDHGRSKGYGFVQYAKSEDAKEALQNMNGFELEGRLLRVGLGNDKFTNPQAGAQQLPASQAGVYGSGGRGTHAGGDISYDSRSRREDRGGVGNASALNDLDMGEPGTANISRHDLMKKLMREGDEDLDFSSSLIKPKAAEPPTQGPPPSRCIMLSNMYDPAVEEEKLGPKWKDDLLLDIRGECELKFGKVVHIDTDPNTAEVYVKFAELESGDKAMKGLNGRWFSGKMVTAEPKSEPLYNSMWRKAENL